MNKPYTSRLPLETLCEIFRLCLTPHTAPWFLGKICAAWRDIVWSTPHLWNSVSIKFSCDKFNSQIELLKEWLARSDPCPLSIHIAAENALWKKCPPEDVVRIIEPHAMRWHHADLGLPLSSLSGLSHQRDQFPLLNSLVIRPQVVPDAAPDQAPVDVFCLAPQLRVVELGFFCPLSHISLPWHHLTTFSGEMTVGSSIDLLRQTPRLVNCTFHVPFTDDTTYYPNPTLLSRLVTLVINSNHSGIAAPILRAVTAPALQVLSIMQASLPDTSNTDILAFLARSACALQKLHWKLMSMDGPQLIKFLRSMPSLVDLNIIVLDNNNPMPPTVQPEEQVALLKLKSFELQYSGDTVALGSILDSMTLPAAESITIQNLRGIQPGTLVPKKPILGFLARSSLVRRLSIKDLFIPAAQLFEHLKSAPLLVELRICNIKEDTPEASLEQDDIIPLLDLSRPDAILPNLEVFDYRDALYFDSEILKDVLASRWRGEHRWVGEDGREQIVARLGSVTIETRRRDDQAFELSASAMAELQQLTDQGLSFSLTSEPSNDLWLQSMWQPMTPTPEQSHGIVWWV